VFDNCGIGKKKSITDPVAIIPFKGQAVKGEAQTTKPVQNTSVVTPLPIIEHEQVRIAPPVGKLSMNRLSIKGNAKVDASKDEKLEVPGGTQAENTYEKDDLTMAWRAAAHRLEDANHLMKVAMQARDLIDKGNHYYEFKFDNDAMKDRFNSSKHEILFYIRERLKNRHVQIDGTVVEQVGVSQIRNSKTIFQELIQVNPSLSNLQKMFGLEIDN
jgi:hypothetical protein